MAIILYLKDAEIDSCSWKKVEKPSEGSEGVECPNLDDLKAHADKMATGQTITCSRYLKNRDSMITHLYIVIFYA